MELLPVPGAASGRAAGLLAGAANTPLGPPVAVGADGTASITTTALPSGTYQLSAEFTPADLLIYAPSISAVTITVNTVIELPLIELTADVAPGAFSLNVTSNSAVLAGGTVGGSAAGTLPEATVIDLRGTNSGWDLTGQVGSFTHSTRPAKSIPGAHLGWTPSALKVSGSGAVQAGPPVIPGTTPGGLADGVTLCSTSVSSSAGTFRCDAGLTLNIPDTTLPGSYSAILTLTLI